MTANGFYGMIATPNGKVVLAVSPWDFAGSHLHLTLVLSTFTYILNVYKRVHNIVKVMAFPKHVGNGGLKSKELLLTVPS